MREAYMIKFIKELFDFREQKKQLLHIVFICFLVAFVIARAWSLIVGNSIYIKGYQIHHFYFGSLILATGALLGLLSEGKKHLRIAAGLIGIGIGLFADEIGLLLNCTTRSHVCLYAFPDTADIIGTISGAILLVLIYVNYRER